MIGLVVTVNGTSRVAAAQSEDGVCSVMAHAVWREAEEGVDREALLDVGTDYSRLLVVGDTVLLRMLGG